MSFELHDSIYSNSDSLWDRNDDYCKRRIQVAKVLIERLTNS